MSIKSQGRPLAAETRVRFALVQNLNTLYKELVAGPARKPVEILKVGNDMIQESLQELEDYEGSKLNIKPLLFVESNLVTRPQNSQSYSTIDEAINHLFNLKDYTLLRITRAAATEPCGAILLKIESAMPGSRYLNDDEYDDDEILTDDDILGQLGDRPSTTFLKKKVARPRYKCDMRIYVLPRIANVVMYLEERMLKRDLIKGVLNLSKNDRTVLCAFNPSNVLSEVDSLGLHRHSVGTPFNLSMPLSQQLLPQTNPDQDLQDVMLNLQDHKLLPAIPLPSNTLQDADLQYYSLMQVPPPPLVGQHLEGIYSPTEFFQSQQLLSDIYNSSILNNYSFGIYSNNMSGSI